MRTIELRRLADAVEQVDPEKFNMAQWWANDCGCAIGWGVKLDVLPAGLTLKVLPRFNEEFGFAAIAEAFDLTDKTVRYLFDDEWYPEDEFPVITPADVARRIREVAGDGS